MGAKYALAIGIRKSGQLPALDGAIADARSFAEWARSPSQGYGTSVVTDETEPVTVDRLKREINKILEEDVTRLLIFYSGHGICAQAGDYWLLSHYDRDGDEAVNLAQSVRNGRRLGIAQIAIFSDACRSSLNTAAYVGGRVIFPVPAGARLLAHYDEFLSTDIGDAAQEVPGEDPAKSYGVFSRCLLTALHGLEPDVIESRIPRKVITSVSLANWLEKAVPLQSGKIPGAAVQHPSISTGWREPDDEYAELTTVVDASASMKALDTGSRRLLDWVSRHQNIGLAERRAIRNAAQAKVAESKAGREKIISERTDAFLAARDRAPTTLEPTMTIVGTKIVEVVAPSARKIDLIEDAGAWHVLGNTALQTIALRTVEDLWIPATLLPVFNGTLVVGSDGVESLNYAPSRNTHERESNQRSDETVARWNALLSIGRTVNAEDLTAFADQAREFKHVNPAFGILAAYAYERGDRIDEVARVAWYFLARNQFVPFDVWALLSAYGDPLQLVAEHGDVPEQTRVAGAFPLLTRGWSLFDPDKDGQADLARLRTGLRDSVWTTFDAETGAVFAQMIEDRRI